MKDGVRVEGPVLGLNGGAWESACISDPDGFVMPDLYGYEPDVISERRFNAARQPSLAEEPASELDECEAEVDDLAVDEEAARGVASAPALVDGAPGVGTVATIRLPRR